MVVLSRGNCLFDIDKKRLLEVSVANKVLTIKLYEKLEI